MALATIRSSTSFGACLTLNPLGLLLHWCSRVADGDAFVQILPQECFAAAEPLMLCRMCKLVNGQTALVPVVVANGNAVTQCEADGTR